MSEMILSLPRSSPLSEHARYCSLAYGSKLILEVQRLPKGDKWELPFHFSIRTRVGDDWKESRNDVRKLVVKADASGEQGLRTCKLDIPTDGGSGAYESQLDVVLQWHGSGEKRLKSINIKHDVGNRVFFQLDVPRGAGKHIRTAPIEYLCRRQSMQEKFLEFLEWQYAGYYVPPIGSYKQGEYRTATIWSRFQEEKGMIRVSTNGARHDKGSVCSTLAGQFLGYWLNYHEKFKFGFGGSMPKLLEGYGAFVKTKTKTPATAESGKTFIGWHKNAQEQLTKLQNDRKQAKRAYNQAQKNGNTTLAAAKQAEIDKLTDEIKEKKKEIENRKKPWQWNSKKLFEALAAKDMEPGDMLVCSNGGHVWLFVKFGVGFMFPKKYIFGNGQDADKSGGSGPWYGEDCDPEGWYLIHASGPGGVKMVYYEWDLEKLDKELAFWKARADLKNSPGLAALNRKIETYKSNVITLNKARRNNKLARKNSSLNLALRYWNRDVITMNNQGPVALGVEEFEARLDELIREVDQVLGGSSKLTNMGGLNSTLKSILDARKRAGKPPSRKKVPTKKLKVVKVVTVDGPLAPPAPYKPEDFYPNGRYSDTETWQQLATAVENQINERKNLLNSVNELVEATNQSIAELNESLGDIGRPTVRLKATVGYLEKSVKSLNKLTKEDTLDDIRGKIAGLTEHIEVMKSDPEAGAVTVYGAIRGTRVKHPDRKLPRPVGGIPELKKLPEIKIAKLFRDAPLPWMNGHIKINSGKVQIARTMVQKGGVWQELFEPYNKSDFKAVELKHDMLNSDGWVADSGALTFNYDCRPFSWSSG